jgi:hypothetical protein
MAREPYVDVDVNNLCMKGAPPSLQLKYPGQGGSVDAVVSAFCAKVAHRIRNGTVPGMAARITKFRDQRGWSFALSTGDELDARSWLQQYVARMGWRLGKPPPRTPLFPRLTDGGAWKGAYDTNDHTTRSMRGYMRDAGIAGADSYCLSGFRPGGHTNMLVATDGNQAVADARAAWDTNAAERRSDRRDVDAWLGQILPAHFRGLRVGAEPGTRAK